MKPRKGISFFLRAGNQYAFCITLSSKPDEDGEYKIARTAFTDNKADAMNLPISEVAMFDFEDNQFVTAEEWDADAIRYLTKRVLYSGTSIPVHKRIGDFHVLKTDNQYLLQKDENNARTETDNPDPSIEDLDL